MRSHKSFLLTVGGDGLLPTHVSHIVLEALKAYRYDAGAVRCACALRIRPSIWSRPRLINPLKASFAD